MNDRCVSDRRVSHMNNRLLILGLVVVAGGLVIAKVLSSGDATPQAIAPRVDPLARGGNSDVLCLRVHQLRIVAGRAYLLHREHQLQRNVRVTAAEVRRAAEVPIRIDE